MLTFTVNGETWRGNVSGEPEPIPPEALEGRAGGVGFRMVGSDGAEKWVEVTRPGRVRAGKARD